MKRGWKSTMGPRSMPLNAQLESSLIFSLSLASDVMKLRIEIL